jgi:serine/threonine-protein phosphatase 2B catalytic subunit
MEGYKMYKWNGNNHFPTVITLFSAPNYCDVYHNKGAIIKFAVNDLFIQNNQLNIQQYNC